MAKTVFNNNETLGDFITKMNQVSNDAGNLFFLEVEDSNLVDAANRLRDHVAKYDDSAEHIRSIREGITEFKVRGEGTIDYNSATGVLQYTQPDSADYYYFSAVHPIELSPTGQQVKLSKTNIDASLIENNTISLTKDYNYQILYILDADSNVLFTFYTPDI